MKPAHDFGWRFARRDLVARPPPATCGWRGVIATGRHDLAPGPHPRIDRARFPPYRLASRQSRGRHAAWRTAGFSRPCRCRGRECVRIGYVHGRRIRRRCRRSAFRRRYGHPDCGTGRTYRSTRAALLGSVCIGALAMLGPGTAHAVDGTWTGPGGEWTTGTNWSSPTPTVPDNMASFTNNGAPTSVTHLEQRRDQHHRLCGRGARLFVHGSELGDFTVNSTSISTVRRSCRLHRQRTLTFNTPTATTAAGQIDISGTGGLTKTGAGLLVLSGNNTYAGPTAINSGALVAASNDALPGDTAVTLSGRNAGDRDTYFAQIGSLAAGPAAPCSSARPIPTPLLFIAGSTSTTFSGVISGPGSIELDDAASLRLTGAGNGGSIVTSAAISTSAFARPARSRSTAAR